LIDKEARDRKIPRFFYVNPGAPLNVTVCPHSYSGFASCAEIIAGQVQAVYDDKY
jgi:hypothetical protein